MTTTHIETLAATFEQNVTSNTLYLSQLRERTIENLRRAVAELEAYPESFQTQIRDLSRSLDYANANALETSNRVAYNKEIAAEMRKALIEDAK